MSTEQTRNYDFADSRMLRGEDARIDRAAQRMGIAGSASPLPAKNEPTAGDIRRAQASAVGGGPKRCTKGKNCSATCIHMNDDCLVELPEPVGVALKQVSRMLDTMVSEGRITEEDAEKVVSDIKSEKEPKGKKGSDRFNAFKEFAEGVKNNTISDQEKESVAKFLISTVLVPGQDRNAARVMNFDEVEAALKPGRLEAFDKAYKASFVDNKFNPSAPGGMGDFIKNNFLKYDVSDEVATMAYNMLPSKVRSAIDRAGSVTQMYAGEDKNGNIKFSEKPTRERGIFLVKRYMEQGGVDPYTGKRIDIRNAEPEHLVAFAHAGAKGGGGDQPRNLLWASAQPNNQKAASGDNFLQWKSTLESYRAMGREEYNKQVYQPAEAKAQEVKGRKAAAPTDIERALSAASPQERVTTIKGLVSAYGSEFRYLLRAANVGYQHQDRDLDHRKGGKPAFINAGVPKLPGYKVKPSTAILVALAAVDPSQRKALLDGLEQLKKGRVLTDNEVQSVKGNNSARLALQKQKNSEYGSKLATLLEQYLPNLGSLL